PIVGLVIIVLAALTTGSLEKTRFLQALEMANLDAWIVSQNPSPSKDIVMVDIDQNDYHSAFASTSPLVAEGVKNLITKIASAGARVIVVDLDTAHWTREDLPPGWLERLPHPLTADPSRVIWARTMSEERDGPVLQSRLAGREDKDLDEGKNTICWGVPEILQSGGVVRSYRARIPTTIAGTTVPSLATAAAILFASADHRASRPTRPVRVTAVNCDAVSSQFESVYETLILKAGSLKFDKYHSADVRAHEGFPLLGKIVVLGGTFAEARDSYHTPAGTKDGLEILATAIASELDDPKPLEPSGWEFITVDIVLGLLLLLAGRLLPRVIDLLVVILGVPVAAFLGSYALYHSSSYFFSFMPVLLGVFLHKVFDQWREGHRASKKIEGVEKLQEENMQLKRDLAALDDTRKTWSERDSVNVLVHITQERA
ncbi:MAG: CHASE2 domain-containing protein, partial [Thermoanaerobaculia bacterium]